jgi:DNA-binding transcriptional ArsR family regulator
MANYGPRGRGDEELRDWLLGGNRKRQILDCLGDAPADGWSAEALARHLDIGPATVYETLRALRGAALLETPKPRRHRLAAGSDLADALRALIVVLKSEGTAEVERPRRVRRRGS